VYVLCVVVYIAQVPEIKTDDEDDDNITALQYYIKNHTQKCFFSNWEKKNI